MVSLTLRATSSALAGELKTASVRGGAASDPYDTLVS